MHLTLNLGPGLAQSHFLGGAAINKVRGSSEAKSFHNGAHSLGRPAARVFISALPSFCCCLNALGLGWSFRTLPFSLSLAGLHFLAPTGQCQGPTGWLGDEEGARKYQELSRAKSSFSGQAVIRFLFLAQKYITNWPKTMGVLGSICGLPMAFKCSPQTQPCLLAFPAGTLLEIPVLWRLCRRGRI